MTNEIEYLFDTIPEVGGVQKVADGVLWLRMPLPFRLDHINLWLIDDGAGWAIVDTGIKSNTSKDVWRRVFADELGGRPITRVIVTHFHPDHVGLAAWLTETLDVALWMPRTEWLFARMLAMDGSDAFMDVVSEFYRRAGTPQAFLSIMRGKGAPLPKLIGSPARGIQRIRDGDEIDIGGRAWRVVVGTGHSPEHACLHCPSLGLMISGDQVLPRISPHIGVYPNEPDGNPLQDFLDSIEKFFCLPADMALLPSHNEPFKGLHVRLKQLADHHEEQLDTLLGFCTTPGNAADLAASLFNRELDHEHTAFAINETLAHLHLLMARGLVVRRDGEDGVYTYERA